MDLDEEMLAAARHAQERLIEAEHDAEVARAEFHRAVRRLHLHGGSLRDLAQVLGLSHQRVHQIVEAAGGSRRWGRRRATRPAAVACTFCGQQHPDPSDTIAGPGVHICETCATRAAEVLGTGQPAAAGATLIRSVTEHEKRERCSFCGRYRPQCTGLAAAASPAAEGKTARHVAICAECLALCAEIIAERRS
jgi:ClpX C4-type zinc finger